jgi:ferredoxin
MDIMLAAKSGREAAISTEKRAECVGCGRCEKACPRGLAPYLEISKWKVRAEVGIKHS